MIYNKFFTKKYVIGLTGGIGSGKSTISKIFSYLGVTVIDEDNISKKVVQNKKILSHISSHFGSKILLSNGKLNRIELRKKIFIDKKEKYWLDCFLHPIIKNYTISNLYFSNTNSYILLVSPVFIERNLQKLVDRLLVIDINPVVQIDRVINRDKVNSEHVENILNCQISQKKRLIYANDIIENNGRIENLIIQILHLHKFYMKMSHIVKNFSMEK